MTYREADAAGLQRAEAEIAAREALAPLVAEGRARRERQGGAALLPMPRRVALLPAREIDHELELLPIRTVSAVSRALSPTTTAGVVRLLGPLLVAFAVGAAAGVTAVALILVPLALGVAGALAASSSLYRLHREVSWVRSLPFPVRGYYDSFVRDGATRLLIEAEVELPVDDVGLVVDLIDRVRGEVPVTTERLADGLRIVAAAPPKSLLVAFRHAILDEVLRPLHALHPIARVRLLWLRDDAAPGGDREPP